MNTNLFKISPQVPLRLGLALTYFYSGSGMIREPESWSWYIPSWIIDLVTQVTTVNTYLMVQGIGEVLIGLLLLSWFLSPKFVRVLACLGTFHIASILLLVGLDPSTFRDFGLLGAWVALALLAHKQTGLTK